MKPIQLFVLDVISISSIYLMNILSYSFFTFLIGVLVGISALALNIIKLNEWWKKKKSK